MAVLTGNLRFTVWFYLAESDFGGYSTLLSGYGGVNVFIRSSALCKGIEIYYNYDDIVALASNCISINIVCRNVC
jgi:hypothetical protein